MRRHAAGDSPLEDLVFELLGAPTAADAIAIALKRSAQLLDSHFARLVVVDDQEMTCWHFEDGSVSSGPPTGFDATLREASGRSPGDVLQEKYVVEGKASRVLVRQTPQLEGGAFLFAVGRAERRRFDEPARVLMRRLSALVVGALTNRQLVAGLVERADALEHQATHDPLTGLANRLRFQEVAEVAIRRGRAGAVLLFDLDRFKEVNDTLGHHVGDQVLLEVATRIRDSVSGGSVMARLGGDEFAILLEPRSKRDLLSMARGLHDCLERPVYIDDFAVDIGASIGIALAGQDSPTLGAMLRCADVAMYAAKAAHKAIEVYRPELDNYLPETLALVPKFRGAVEQNELHVAFQAQYDAQAGQIVGAEALARWSIPGHGPVSPNEFIPIAERTGLIHPLTRRVLAEAVDQCAVWQADTDQTSGVGEHHTQGSH